MKHLERESIGEKDHRNGEGRIRSKEHVITNYRFWTMHHVAVPNVGISTEVKSTKRKM